jgi:hypothetical protein
MLANLITHNTVQDVKPIQLMDADVILDRTSRKCAVRRQNDGALQLVKPRSGVAHQTNAYKLPEGGLIRIIGRVEGGWAGDASTTPKAAKPKAAKPKASKPKAAKPKGVHPKWVASAAKAKAEGDASLSAWKAQQRRDDIAGPATSREENVASVLRSLATLLDGK